MASVVGGRRPDITAAQIVSAVPVLVGVLAAFGVWDPTQDQKDALEMAIAWAIALVFGDAGLRAARGFAIAKQDDVYLRATGGIPDDSPVAPAGQGTTLPPPPPVR